ncbi:acyltransferase family protein [Bryobacter aggregatus]|uniref:acyltransferase family protein n=1 Tax=Bryobacter aggregatus TaxID=360054 RepID=UPI0004E20FA3|nr:heparan-alpha-glucosaminide N-acetyltransferase domain-containing protein [Bryobacter aggregatus]
MPHTRLLSLDAFRGLTIALMVLVNTPGDHQNVYAPLRHADWHGWTITDCIFPSFVWIVGVAISLALGRKLVQGTVLYRDIFRRTAILFGLGVLLYAFPSFPIDSFRILGVLQRIAICYCITSLLFLHTGVREQIAAIFALLAGYWAIMAWVPAPGFAAGDLSVEGNIAHYVDRVLLGAHNYSHTKTWDPEGVLSTLPAIATCLLGVVAGHVLRSAQAIDRRVQQLLIIGMVLCALALVMDPVLPINKKLWTSSFTLWMAGLDFIVFGVLLWFVDGRKIIAPFRPFLVLGANAIAIYLCSEFLDIILSTLGWREPIYQTLFAPYFAPMNASLAFALCYVLLHFGIAYAMWQRKWFLRV